MRVGFRAVSDEVAARRVGQDNRHATAVGGEARAILLNPLYPGTVEPDTPLKLVMIMEDDRPFVRRPDFFYSHPFAHGGGGLLPVHAGGI